MCSPVGPRLFAMAPNRSARKRHIDHQREVEAADPPPEPEARVGPRVGIRRRVEAVVSSSPPTFEQPQSVPIVRT